MGWSILVRITAEEQPGRVGCASLHGLLHSHLQAYILLEESGFHLLKLIDARGAYRIFLFLFFLSLIMPNHCYLGHLVFLTSIDLLVEVVVHFLCTVY